MTALIGAVIGFAGNIFLFILRWLGAKEATTKAVRQAIDEMTGSRRDETLPGDAEDEAWKKHEEGPKP